MAPLACAQGRVYRTYTKKIEFSAPEDAESFSLPPDIEAQEKLSEARKVDSAGGKPRLVDLADVLKRSEPSTPNYGGAVFQKQETTQTTNSMHWLFDGLAADTLQRQQAASNRLDNASAWEWQEGVDADGNVFATGYDGTTSDGAGTTWNGSLTPDAMGGGAAGLIKFDPILGASSSASAPGEQLSEEEAVRLARLEDDTARRTGDVTEEEGDGDLLKRGLLTGEWSPWMGASDSSDHLDGEMMSTRQYIFGTADASAGLFGGSGRESGDGGESILPAPIFSVFASSDASMGAASFDATPTPGGYATAGVSDAGGLWTADNWGRSTGGAGGQWNSGRVGSTPVGPESGRLDSLFNVSPVPAETTPTRETPTWGQVDAPVWQ